MTHVIGTLNEKHVTSANALDLDEARYLAIGWLRRGAVDKVEVRTPGQAPRFIYS